MSLALSTLIYEWRRYLAAVIALGTGFLRHPANRSLRDDFDQDTYKRALLRLVYGRLDPDHTPPVEVLTSDVDLDLLRQTFPGF